MTSIHLPYSKHWEGITIATHGSFDSWPYQPSQRIPMETIFWHWKAKWFSPFPLAVSQMAEKNLCNANIISNCARASSACAFCAPSAMARFNRNYEEENGRPWTQLKSQHCHWVLLYGLFFFYFSLLPQCIVQLINSGPKRTAQCIILLLYTLKNAWWNLIRFVPDKQDFVVL